MSRSMVCSSLQLGFGVEGEGAGAVIIAGDGRQLAAAFFEEGAFDFVVPLDGIENADGALGFNEAITEGANEAFVGAQGPVRLAIDAVERGFAHRLSTCRDLWSVT